MSIRCIQDWALQEIRADRVEPESFLAALGVRMLLDPTTNSGCHDFWHFVAEELGRRFDPKLLFQAAPYNCSGAFYHGAGLGSALALGPDAFARAVDGMCDPFVSGPRVIYLDCIHSIGHGFGALKPFPDVLSMCTRYADDDEELYWCGWGATESGLQNRYGVGEAKYNKSIEELTLRIPRDEAYKVIGECAEVEVSGLRRACFKLTLRLLNNIEEPYVKIAKWCGALPPDSATDCADSAGELAAIKFLRGSSGEYDLCVQHTKQGPACTLGYARPIARVDEWDDRFGLSGAEAAPADERLSGCVLVSTTHPEFQDICEREDAYTHKLELSPTELDVMDAALLPELRLKMPAYASEPVFKLPDGSFFEHESTKP